MEQRNRQPVRHDVEHGDADVGAFAVDAAPDQGFENDRVRGCPGRDFDD
jgi:hypothetical protein